MTERAEVVSRSGFDMTFSELSRAAQPPLFWSHYRLFLSRLLAISR